MWCIAWLFSILASGLPQRRPTEVIHYAPPTALPAATKAGQCWTNSIAAPYRADAWRCMVGNSIHDPCFATARKRRVLCDANPAADQPGFQLILTKPLPKSEPPAGVPEAAPWLLELEDGAWCAPLTGTNPEFDGEVAHYDCKGDAMLLGDLNRASPAWTTERIVVAPSGSGLVIRSRATVAVRRAWE